ncbi:Prolipoprotein diacylglyceryl transferase [uncultured Roseburia sp.]|uniref:Prolipoprotein diacylglyceryl transferase n=2 Tax=Brotonthovivens ammoniilytica TaxID=2981725 RepID=A0ABT2TJT8_9FIRM|nr:prolipoprotein diacylglyceryl transferase [Brotonthovivens ammoniilytica]MCU6762487.1 prolipoprotein diacylglyceryl transferase [Brotonthovivens ammoniilytica]SCI73442.1 Prolipoprotein diacylglyceryl transferase [uncultured Roseburia sp.]
MHVFFHFGNLSLPGYSLMIIIGLAAGNVLVWLLGKRHHLIYDDFLLLEAYTFLGAMIGAKGLYLFVARNEIQWSRLAQADYLKDLMVGGFVFYGGLIGGFLFFLLAGKIHKVDIASYMRRFMFVIPFIHGFGRLGCLMAGCCYGRPYNGPGAVVFPDGSFAPAGIPLFPVQLAEAVCLFVLAGFLFGVSGRIKSAYQTAALYFGIYGVIRFVLEYFRYDDAERGGFAWFSTSQWISIGIVIFLIITGFIRMRKRHGISQLRK